MREPLPPPTKIWFTPEETRCRCGCGEDIEEVWRVRLSQIREAYGKPISLTSAKRCTKRNAESGGAPKSMHLLGLAADLVRTPGLLAFIILNLEKFDLRMEDVSWTPSWIHIDDGYHLVNRGRGPRIFQPRKVAPKV